MTLTAYLHVARLGRWEPIARELLGRLDACGLAPHLDRLTIGWSGAGRAPAWLRAAGDVIAHGDVLPAGEVPTLRLLRDACRADPRGHVLYLHAKGSSHPPGPTDRWRAFLADGVLARWRECVGRLEEGYDAAGNEWYGPEREAEWRRVWRTGPCDLMPHFCGNYFWARRAYVARLPALPMTTRWDSEYRFIGTGGPRVYCPEFAGIDWYSDG